MSENNICTNVPSSQKFRFFLHTKALKQFKVSGILSLKDPGCVTRLCFPNSERCSDRGPTPVVSLTAQPIKPLTGSERRDGKIVVG
jgi:hypothetical protein